MGGGEGGVVGEGGRDWEWLSRDVVVQGVPVVDLTFLFLYSTV